MKVVLLFSTGLDSFLAYHLLKKLGYQVILLAIKTPFVKLNEKFLKEISKEDKLIIHEAKEDYLEILKKPKYGFGSQANPCIDCKIYMLKIAKKVMEEEKADFIVTGEVLNERYSQKLENLKIIEKEAGVERLVVRILSGKLLPKTIPEEKGWIKRENLLDIKGRRREKQLNLVKELNIQYYPQPAGGCLLTDPQFAKRIKDLLKFKSNFSLRDVELLKIGRHFRINSSKLILGRNKEENEILEKNKDDLILLKPKNCKGPSGLFEGEEKDLEIAIKILASYCEAEKVIVEILNKEKREIEVERESRENFKKFLIK